MPSASCAFLPERARRARISRPAGAANCLTAACLCSAPTVPRRAAQWYVAGSRVWTLASSRRCKVESNKVALSDCSHFTNKNGRLECESSPGMRALLCARFGSAMLTTVSSALGAHSPELPAGSYKDSCFGCEVERGLLKCHMCTNDAGDRASAISTLPVV